MVIEFSLKQLPEVPKNTFPDYKRLPEPRGNPDSVLSPAQKTPVL